MAPAIAFWVGGGLYGIAVIAGLVGDGVNRGRGSAVISGALLLVGGLVGIAHAWQSQPVFVVDTFVVGSGFSLAAGLAGVLAACAVFADRTAQPSNSGQRAALMALAALGASLASQSGDPVTLVISLEIAAASSYAIVALDRSRRSFEAATKYFVQGSVGTALLLLAVAILAGSTSSSSGYSEFNRAIADGATTPLLLGVVLLVAGLAFKAGAAPFHSWAPDAYESAPPSGGAVLAGAVKLSAVTALCVAVGATATSGLNADAPLGLIGVDLFPILGALSVLSIAVGSIAALRQRSYLRMLGYAGVAQVGYALMALAAASPTSALVAIATYAFATTGAFLVAQVAQNLDAEWDGTIDGLSGLARRLPFVGAAITALMLSMAGIPAFLGFWGKLQVFQSAVLVSVGLSRQGYAGIALGYALLAVVGVVGAIVSVGYYGAVVRAVYATDERTSAIDSAGPVAPRVVVFVLGAAALVLGAAPLFVPSADVIRGFLM